MLKVSIARNTLKHFDLHSQGAQGQSDALYVVSKIHVPDVS